jgi:cell division protein FtsQ
MRKTDSRRSASRLVAQRPAKKARLFQRRPRNLYRRGGGSRGSWRRRGLLTLGLLTVAGLSLGLVLAYHQLLTSPWFCIKDIKNIEIEGLRKLTPELVLEQARLGPETNLLALRPGQAEQALMAHPWIARAELTRKWPHRLHLRLKEREPVALVQMGELYYVDRQGSLSKSLTPGDPHNFPVLTGLAPEHFTQGEGPLPEVLGQAFQLLELLRGAAPPLNLENISEVHVDLERGFTLYANGLGVALDLGFTDHQEKLQKFAQIWPILRQTGYLARAGRINLDYPQRALLSLKGMDEK